MAGYSLPWDPLEGSLAVDSSSRVLAFAIQPAARPLHSTWHLHSSHPSLLQPSLPLERTPSDEDQAGKARLAATCLMAAAAPQSCEEEGRQGRASEVEHQGASEGAQAEGIWTIWGLRVGQQKGESAEGGEANWAHALCEGEREREGDGGPWEQHTLRCASPCCLVEHRRGMAGRRPGSRAWKAWGPLGAAAWAAGMAGEERAWSWGRREALMPNQ